MPNRYAYPGVHLGSESKGSHATQNLIDFTTASSTVDYFDTLGFNSIEIGISVRTQGTDGVSSTNFMGVKLRHSNTTDNADFEDVHIRDISVPSVQKDLVDGNQFLTIKEELTTWEHYTAEYLGNKRYIQIWSVENGTVGQSLRFGFSVHGLRAGYVT